jgi:magnesium transporter
MIKIFKKTLKDEKIREIKETVKGSWIYIIEPSKKELRNIAKHFNLNRDILEDCLDEYELPRLEKENFNFYNIIRVPFIKEGTISTIPILIVITNENIITICKSENEILNNLIMEKVRIFTTQKTHFLLNVYHLTITNYDSYLKKISKEVKSKKIKIESLVNEDIINLVHYEETLNDFISSFVPMINILQRILSTRYITIYERDKDIIEDLLMDSKQTHELSITTIKLIKNIREAYSTILTNNLNKIIKLFTSLMIILTIPMIVSSVYGMNISLPLQNSQYSFFYIVLIILIFTFLVTLLFIKKRWL